LPWLAVLRGLDADFWLRNDGRASRTFDPVSLVFLGAAVPAWLAAVRVRVEARPLFVWLGAALLGVGAALCQQLATGIVVQPFHWALVGIFLIGLAVAAGACLAIPEGRGWTVVLAGLFILAGFRGVGYARLHAGSHLRWGETREALEWLSANARPGEIVATLSPNTNLLLPIYTRVKTLAACNSPSASDLSTAENAARLAFGARLLGVGARRFESYALPADPPQRDDTAYGPGEEYKVELGAEKVFFPYVFFSEFPRHHLPAAFREAFSRADRSFPVDYLWIGPFEKGLLEGRVPRRLGQPLFRNAWIAIYRCQAASGMQ
ncbi:MAG: hypothetical protein PHF00_08225, partial [Elusimicrobia bacterium]|nr:hypothetical protein [Elusimicrobiota bacterium]